MCLHFGHDLGWSDAARDAELADNGGINRRIAGQGGEQPPPDFGIGLILIMGHSRPRFAPMRSPALGAAHRAVLGSREDGQVFFIALICCVNHLTRLAEKIRAPGPRLAARRSAPRATAAGPGAARARRTSAAFYCSTAQATKTSAAMTAMRHKLSASVRSGGPTLFGRPQALTAHQRQEIAERLAEGAVQADLARSYEVERKMTPTAL
jgi:hypothetical protein